MVVNILVSTEQPIEAGALRRVLNDRLLQRFRRFRQRVDDPALTVGVQSAPSWLDDDSFNLANHLRVSALPAPGDQAALQRVLGRLASRALDRRRPLWELHLLKAYGAGSVLLLRTHRAIADGAALMQVLLAITDPTESDEHTSVLGWDDTIESRHCPQPQPELDQHRCFRAAPPPSELQRGTRLLRRRTTRGRSRRLPIP